MKTQISVSGWRLAVVALLATLNASFTTSASNAPLQYNGDYQGGRMIYDPNQNITWYQATYARSNWWDAEAWAASANIGGVTGWRLPAAPSVVDNGLQMVITGNPDDGELGYLWYDELGNHAGSLTNWGPFDPTTWQYPYAMAFWTGSGPWYGHLSGYAVYFAVSGGNYGLATIPPWTPGLFPSMMVHDGDVGPNGIISTNTPPELFISRSGNAVILSWTTTANWNLEQNANLATANWTTNTGWTTSNGTNSLLIPNPAGNWFFRLAK